MKRALCILVLLVGMVMGNTGCTLIDTYKKAVAVAEKVEQIQDAVKKLQRLQELLENNR